MLNTSTNNSKTWGYATLKSANDSVAHHSGDFRPLASSSRNSVNSNQRHIAAIRTLLDVRCPSAICFAIISIGINSIKRICSSWVWLHIGKKVLKVDPSFAVDYVSPAIVVIVSVVGVVASIFHVHPRTIQWSPRPASSTVTMFEKACGSSLSAITAATASRSVWASEAVYENRFFRSAFASAIPAIVLALFAVKRQYSESSKNLSGAINSHSIFLS